MSVVPGATSRVLRTQRSSGGLESFIARDDISVPYLVATYDDSSSDRAFISKEESTNLIIHLVPVSKMG